MRSLTLSSLIHASAVSAAAFSHLVPRTDSTPICADLSVSSNNGNRKVAIVIDSSGSMAESDPYDLRLQAGRSLVSFLISDKEAGSGKTADEVCVIDFDDTAELDYPLGDPGNANSSFDNIDAFGGTFIAGGIQLALDQLTTNGTATNTADRSSIVVFTDGEDDLVNPLIYAINNASAAGIRVSFGFLDADGSTQNPEVLVAIGKSGGVYATIDTDTSANNFINYVILNGLTHNDNPTGNNKTLLAGLSTSHFITGSETQNVVYYSQANENVNFTIDTISAGFLTAQVSFGGKTLNSTNASYFDPGIFSVHTANAETLTIAVTAKNAEPDALFQVGAQSNMPAQNCTVGVGAPKGKGLGKGAKVGLGLGVPIAIGVVGLGLLFLLKYLGVLPKVFGGLVGGSAAAGGIGGGAGAGAGAAAAGSGGAAAGGGAGGGAGTGAYAVTNAPVMVEAGKGMTVGVAEIVGIAAAGAAATGATAHALANDGSNVANNPDDQQHHHRFKLRMKHKVPHHHHLFHGHPCAAAATNCELMQQGHICKDPNEEPLGTCVCSDENCGLNKVGKLGIGGHKCTEKGTHCFCEDRECPETKRVERKERVRTGIWVAKSGVSEVVKSVAGV